MFRSKIVPAAMATAVALGMTGAAFAHSGEHEHAAEIAAALSAKTSVDQAIATAEKQAGGRAVKAELEKKKGAFAYEIKILSKEKMAKVFVDPASGKVLRTEDEGLIAKIFDREDRDEFAKLAASPTTLAAAIAAAEQRTGGKALDARFRTEDGKTRFRIKIAKGTAISRVTVDGASGKVLKVAARRKDEDEDHEHGEHHED